MNYVIIYGIYLFEKNKINNFLDDQDRKVLDITLEKIEFSYNILETLSKIIIKRKIRSKTYISEAIKELYNTGYDMGTYKGVRSSGIYCFANDKLIGKNGYINNDRLYKLLKGINYADATSFKVVPMINYSNQGLIISMPCQGKKNKASINLILTNSAINEVLDKLLDVNIEYALFDSMQNMLLMSKGFKKSFINFNDFTLLDLLRNQNKIYTKVLMQKITNEDYFFIVGIPSDIVVKKLLKHILCAAIALNLGIFILWKIIQLAYLKIKDKIHKNFESELKSLKSVLHQLQMQHLAVNDDNQTMKDSIKTIAISNNSQSVLS
ncbi:hypothetical protein NOVO_00850 [Rickettsiales bacterium Ac37b]|nr:hypothetical protein NOVO_00850 [Rickettsiales bacterium Ac37b]